MLDLIRQEYLKGKVVDKYVLSTGNVGLVIEDHNTRQRYHVEFKDSGREPGIENLFGLLNEPFSGKTEQLARLINEGDSVELTVSYSKGPLREAYQIHSVSVPNSTQTQYQGGSELFAFAYGAGKGRGY